MRKVFLICLSSLISLLLVSCASPEKAKPTAAQYISKAEKYIARGDVEEAKKILKEGLELLDSAKIQNMLETLEEPNKADVNVPTQPPTQAKSKLTGIWYYTEYSSPETRADFEKIEIVQPSEQTLTLIWSDGKQETLNVVSETCAEKILTGSEPPLHCKATYSIDYAGDFERLTCIMTDADTGQIIAQPGEGGYRKEGLDALYPDTPPASKTMDTAAINAFLTNQRSFTDFETGQPCTLGTLPMKNDMYMGEPFQYAVTDLDGDGANELLVEYSAMGDTAILRMQNGECIAYYIPYRGRTGLKADGTMGWSNSAFESGTQRLSFSAVGVTSIKIIVYDTEKSIYKINGVAVTENECSQALTQQNAKADVLWNAI